MNRCSVDDFEKAIKEGHCQAIDVREYAEYESEKVAGVKTLPLSGLDKANLADLNKEKPLYLLCNSGNRACKAADKLEKNGFADLRVVDGGLQAWKSAGKEILLGQSKVWSLDRQVRFAAGSMVLAGVILAKTHHPYWIGLSVFVAAGLIFSGVTNTCGMAMLLAKMPWNQKKS